MTRHRHLNKTYKKTLKLEIEKTNSVNNSNDLTAINQKINEVIKQLEGLQTNLTQQNLSRQLSEFQHIIGQFTSQNTDISVQQVPSSQLIRNQIEINRQMDIAFREFNRLSKYFFKNGDKELRRKIRDFRTEFLFCLQSSNLDKMKEIIAEMENLKNQIPELQPSVELLHNNESLVGLLKNEKKLKIATTTEKSGEKPYADWKMMHKEQRIPKTLERYLEENGYCDANGNIYSRRIIAATLSAMQNDEKTWQFTKIIVEYKSYAAAALVTLLLGVGIFFGSQKFLNSGNTGNLAQTQIPTFNEVKSTTVEISQAMVDVVKSYFENPKEKPIPGKVKLTPRIITNQIEFYKYYAPAAIAACQGTGIFPELPLAQAFHETGGYSELFTKYNNMLGIKANKNWKGKTILFKTQEFVNKKRIDTSENFRVYDCIEDCFKDYIEFLRQPHYQGIFEAKTAESQAEFLSKYATDTNYVSRIKKKVQAIQLVVK